MTKEWEEVSNIFMRWEDTIRIIVHKDGSMKAKLIKNGEPAGVRAEKT